MGNTSLPSAEQLRSEMNGAPEHRVSYETSSTQIGCNGCPNLQRTVCDWLSTGQLQVLMDKLPEVPRGFTKGNLSALGKAQPCPTGEAGQPVCQHEEALQTVPALSHAVVEPPPAPQL